MSIPIQSRTRTQIRQSIGRNLGAVVIGAATSTTDSSSLIDANQLSRYTGNDEVNGARVVIYDATGSIVDGEASWVSDFAAATFDATCAPVFSANVTSGDKYELWKNPYTYEDVNDAINQAILAVSDRCLQLKQIYSETEPDAYRYYLGTSFKGVRYVEYAGETGTYKLLHNCDAVWDELVDTDVTASVDTTIKREGTGCLKLVVAANCGAGDILATDSITSTDISGCDTIEVWIYSSTALDAGDIQLLLDNSASCASPVESLNIPATPANIWTRHVITLANPLSDTAIISVGLKMVTDKGAFTLCADHIQAFSMPTRVWNELTPDQWSIVKGSTAYIQLTETGLATCGELTPLRITGYQLPSLMTADTDTSEIDPDFIIKEATGRLFISQSSRLDIQERLRQSERWLGLAQARIPAITTQILGNTRWTT